MTIALICAMPMELRPLAKRLRLERSELHGVTVRSGSLDGRPVVAIATGMGTDLATRSTEALFGAVVPERVLVFGIPGAVDDDIAIGAIVNPELVVNSETGAEYRPELLTDEPAHGTMWTTNVMTPARELPALRDKGVISLDMETAAIADCCVRRGIPWSVHRAISDRATDDSIDDEVFKLAHQDGTPNPRAIARYFLRHPARIPRMARMAKEGKLATERATDAVIAAARRAP